MSTLVDAIRAERRALIEPLLAPIAGKLRTLEEMERLAVSLDGGGSDVPAVAAATGAAGAPKAAAVQRALPRKTAATGQGRDGLTEATQKVLSALRDSGDWIALREIVEKGGVSPGAAKKAVQLLVPRGLVEARGATAARRYRAAQNGTPMRARTTFGQGRSPAAKKTGSLQGRVLEAVGYRPSSANEVAQRLTVPAGEVVAALDVLRDEGEIVLQDDGRYRGT